MKKKFVVTVALTVESHSDVCVKKKEVATALRSMEGIDVTNESWIEKIVVRSVDED